MENKYLYQVMPFLYDIEENRKKEFEIYFMSAPIWVLDSIRVEEMNAGVTFISENAKADTIYFIGKGVIRALDFRIDGITHEFMLFDKVYGMGGMEVIMDLDKYKTTLQTVTPCTFAKIPRSIFEKWIKNDIRALKLEAKIIGEYLLEQGRNSRLYLLLQSSDRLAMLFAKRYEKYSKNGIFETRTTRQELSDATGLCVKTINRSVKKLEDEGLISRKGNSIVISEEQYFKINELIYNKRNEVKK